MSQIHSRIESDFEGADGESVYALTNGQTWQQSRYMYHYHYAYRPRCTIVRDGGGYIMHVEGMNRGIPVKRI